MADTIYATTELVVTKCWCGMPHAVPLEMRDKQLHDHANGRTQDAIYCPLGHTHIISGTSEIEKLRREIERKTQEAIRERQKHDQTRAELRETELRRRAECGAKTRIKNRIANGVCPCCNRSFKDLHAHMKTQHPEFAASE
jgi:hypothetical protein